MTGIDHNLLMGGTRHGVELIDATGDSVMHGVAPQETRAKRCMRKWGFIRPSHRPLSCFTKFIMHSSLPS